VDEIGVALWRLHWFKVAAPPHAQYHLRGSVLKDDRGCERVTVGLLDTLSGRYLWAVNWQGDGHDPIGFEDRISIGVA
jgi:TolB-like protein